MSIADLKVKIFADGADKATMLAMNSSAIIQGLTTNPTLMSKAGIKDYKSFALDILKEVSVKPISFEVFSDEFVEMERQAMEIASWSDNVYVKIPVTTTLGEPSCDLLRRLCSRGVKVNVTAIMSLEQIRQVIPCLDVNVPSYISVFAGRIADTGRDPLPLMISALDIMKSNSCSELIWASPRELLNLFQADTIGCHIITVTHDILKKIPLIGYDLDKYSLDTVKMFFDDASAAGFKL